MRTNRNKKDFLCVVQCIAISDTQIRPCRKQLKRHRNPSDDGTGPLSFRGFKKSGVKGKRILSSSLDGTKSNVSLGQRGTMFRELKRNKDTKG